jgi:hypothetical protein
MSRYEDSIASEKPTDGTGLELLELDELCLWPMYVYIYMIMYIYVYVYIFNIYE